MAESIVSSRLGACVQIDKIKSYYQWDGKMNRNDEYRLMVKTTGNCFERLKEHIVRKHSYSVPEVIRLPIDGGHDKYLRWIDEVVE